MRDLLLTSVLCVGAILWLTDTGHAHGGQYRGPGDTVPPGGGGGGRSGGPSGPTTPGAGSPSAPSPRGPGTGGGGPSTGGPNGGGSKGPSSGSRSGGGPMDEDLTTWDFWWEFNKDPYLRLKDAVHRGGPVTGSDDHYLGSRAHEDSLDSLRPTHEAILSEVMPALKKALDSTEQHDISSSCMVALAKIGTNHPDFRLVDVFRPRLQSGNQEVRETAALAIGLAAIEGADEIELLVGLALDNESGRSACGRTVDDRTRSFAAYGLGLLAHEHTKIAVKAAVFAAMRQLLVDEHASGRNLRVAAIHAISLLNLGTTNAEDRDLLAKAVQCLETFYDKNLGAGEQLLQAHCPTAIAKLIGRDHELSDRFRARFAADLQGKSKPDRTSREIAQSCAIALGQLCRANDEGSPSSPDAAYSETLLDTYRNHKDRQTRSFAILALGQIGGTKNRTLLLNALRVAKGPDKPWCALALGVYSFAAYEAQQATGQSFAPDSLIGTALLDELDAARDPNQVGAFAVALGLNQNLTAAAAMRKRLLDAEAKQDQAGYLCIGLALMNDRASTEPIREVLDRSARRVDLFKQAAIALGKLGDKAAAEYLCGRLAGDSGNLATLSAIASALGYIGDRRSIPTLQRLLFDEKLGALPRAFAAVALGGIADRAPLPWNSKIGVNTNYRANVETLTDQNTGILDIL